MQFFLFRPLAAILTFIIGVLAALPLQPSQIPIAKTKGYSESQVESVNFYDLIEQRGKYDGHVVRLRARMGHGDSKRGLYAIGDGDRNYRTNLTFVCGDSEKCRTVARFMEGDAATDLDVVVTGVFYAGIGSGGPALKITVVNGLSEYTGPGGRGTGQGHGSGDGDGHGGSN